MWGLCFWRFWGVKGDVGSGGKGDRGLGIARGKQEG